MNSSAHVLPLPRLLSPQLLPTLRNINDRLEHQRYQGYEEEIVDEELWRLPFWRGGAIGK